MTVTREAPVVKTYTKDLECPECGTSNPADIVEAEALRNKARRRACKVTFICKSCGRKERSSRTTTIIRGDA